MSFSTGVVADERAIKNIKKEFTTYWATEFVVAEPDKMPIEQGAFFERVGKLLFAITIPTSISHHALSSFVGKKTKVTIEVVL